MIIYVKTKTLRLTQRERESDWTPLKQSKFLRQAKEKFVNSRQCQQRLTRGSGGREIFKSNHWDFRLIDIVLKINYVVYANSGEEERDGERSLVSASSCVGRFKKRKEIKRRKKEGKNRFSSNVKGHVSVGGGVRRDFSAPEWWNVAINFPFEETVTERRVGWNPSLSRLRLWLLGS